MKTIKRIFATDEPEKDIMTHQVHGVTIRRAKNQLHPYLTEYVVEGPLHERNLVNKIVELYDKE